jgi:hypothetical protein
MWAGESAPDYPNLKDSPVGDFTSLFFAFSAVPLSFPPTWQILLVYFFAFQALHLSALPLSIQLN